MWTLAFGQHEDRSPTDDYAATREDAMAAFAKSWRPAMKESPGHAGASGRKLKDPRTKSEAHQRYRKTRVAQSRLNDAVNEPTREVTMAAFAKKCGVE